MRYQTFCAAALASAGLFIVGAPAAHAAEISSVQLEATVLDGDGQPVTSLISGAAYWYTFNYSITGADLTGVGATIAVDLPQGLWAYEQNAPTAFTSSCTQAGANQWKFTCDFTAADLDINTAGGIAGQARVLVRSRRFSLAHGDTVTATGQLTASYVNTAGDPAQATDSGQHTMAFTATPAISGPTAQTHSTLTFNGLASPYFPMVSPDGVPGVAYNVRWNAGNTGSARLGAATLSIDLPAGFMIASGGSSSWVRDTDLWTPGTASFSRTDWGAWTALNAANSPVGTFGNSVLDLTMFAPCSVLADTRLEDDSVPPAMQMNATLNAQGYGVIYADDEDLVGTVATHDLTRSFSGSAPNFTNYSCDGALALFHKIRLTAAGTEGGSNSGWYVRATVPFGTTHVDDAVVWDALDPSFASFASTSVVQPDDGTFTRYLCDLDGAGFNPATARGDFLASWKDDPSRCVATLADSALTTEDITHVFFHAPLWGDPSPTGAYAPPVFYGLLYTTTHDYAAHGDTLSNTAWYEGDGVTLRERTATHEVTDIADPRIEGGPNPFSVTAVNAPFATPGEPVIFGVRPHRSGSVLPRNPAVEITLAPGLLYDSSEVVFGSGCVAEEAAATSAPGTWVPLVYTPTPTVTVADGAITLRWTFGSDQNPFRLRGTCPNMNGIFQVRINVATTVDPNRSYTNGEAVPFSATMTSANQDGPHTSTYDLRVQVPGEMRVEVVPWCEAEGRIGFNSVYENSGGIDLTNVAVVFPIPEQTDPNGAPYDLAHFVDAAFADPNGAVEYSTDGGATWLATPPADLTTVDAVRLLIPTLPANSGPQSFFVNIEVPAGNPGDARVHAAASMEADQLTDASSPVSIPFVVDTCPKPLQVSKFFDADGDGVWDDGEPPLRAWAFEVRDGDVLVASGSTNSAGQVTFTLTQGTYTVTEVLPAPQAADDPTWAPTTGGVSQTIFVGLTEADYSLVFGNNCACQAPDACSVALCDPVQGCLFTPRSCDDGNACTADSCDPVANPVDGCVNTPVAPGATCDDGDACTSGETCDAAGACVPTDVATCAAEGACVESSTCNPATGVCDVTYTAAGAVCAGLDQCVDHACDGQGACVGGASVSCDDNNACTADSCDPATGCMNVPVEAGASCSDDDLCTLGDQCDGAGVCVGRDVECNDHGLCQEPGTCDPGTGECTYAQAPCYLANFWTAVADADGRVLGSIKCGFDAQGEPVCDTHADGSLVIYDQLPCVAAAGTSTLPAGGVDPRTDAEQDPAEPKPLPVGEPAAPAAPEADPTEPTEAP